jgi:hypothetical protein
MDQRFFFNVFFFLFFLTRKRGFAPGVAARISRYALLQHSVAQKGSGTDAEAVGSGLRDSGAGRLGDFSRQSKQQDGGRLSLFSG